MNINPPPSNQKDFKKTTSYTEGKIKKTRNREESISRFLYAGIEVFSEIGYDATTTKMIAVRANLNEVLLFRYFKNKQNLLLEILRYFLKAGDQNDFYPAGKTVEHELINFFKARLKFDKEMHKFLKIVISRSLVDPQLAATIRKTAKPHFANLLIKRLKGFQEIGYIKPEVNIEDLTSIISNQIFMSTFINKILSNKSDYLREFHFLVKIIVNGIVKIDSKVECQFY